MPSLIAFLFPSVIPIAHIVILWYFWQNYARYVDKRFCSCSCWDTVVRKLILYKLVKLLRTYEIFKWTFVSFLFSNSVQSNVRERHCFLQEFLLQRNNKYVENMVVYCDWNNFIIRMRKISCQSDHIGTIEMVDGISFHLIYFFTLLFVVGVSREFIDIVNSFINCLINQFFQNYLNDDFYSQWSHQTFFTVSF